MNKTYSGLLFFESMGKCQFKYAYHQRIFVYTAWLFNFVDEDYEVPVFFRKWETQNGKKDEQKTQENSGEFAPR